jgi:LacI family transcriptional regulator
MKDVAAEAGVSLKTVSRVMNGVTTVDPAMSARVFEAVDRLGFVTNFAASGLRRSNTRSHQIGAVLVADPMSTFLGSLVEPIQHVVMDRGSMLLASTVTKGSGLEEDFVRAFVSRRVDGIILAPSSPNQTYLARLVGGIPIVCVDRPAAGVSTDLIMATNYAGGFEAVTHLISHGHRRIAYIGDLEAYVNATERFTGYVGALNAAGLSVDPAWVRHGIRTSAAAEEATHEIFAGPETPTAVFTSQSAITLGMLRALRDLGLQTTIAHIGFDDMPLADLVTPAVTVIAQDSETMGRRTAEMLFRRIEGPAESPQRIDVPTRLIVRGSGEIPPRS